MFSRSNPLLPIAIDVGTSSIKMLQLHTDDDHLRVHAAAKIEIPPQVRRAEERQDLIVDALHEVLKSQPFKGREIRTIVPNHAVHFKSFRIPQMPQGELHQAILFEAEERFAFDRPDAEYRYLDAGEIRQGQGVRREIIAMGCTSETLKSHLDVFDRLKLVCLAMDVAPCAIVRSLEWLDQSSEEEQARIYADIGQHATRIAITCGGKVCFVKSIPIGSTKLDELTAKKLNLPAGDAVQLRREILKYHAQAEPDSTKDLQQEIRSAAFEAVRPAIGELGKEIALCLRYYAVTFRGVRPEELTCVGGESYDPQLRAALSEITGIKAVAGTPLRQMDAANAFSDAACQSGLLEWATAVGLSVRQRSPKRLKKTAS